LGLALLSLVLMFADNNSDYMVKVRYYVAFVVTPLHYVAELPGKGLQLFGGLFETRNQLQRENASLQEQLLMQQYQLQKLQHLTAENQRLNELLNASTVVREDVVRVEMVGESPDPFSKRILIDKGATDGVTIGQAVFDADGLMGQVVEVNPLNSWVLLITDPQHATPVQVNRNGMRAIASGTRDSLHLLNLDNIPNTADIQVGDELVTSGLGERFPAGYRVGLVTSVTNDPGKPFATVVVTPAARIDRSRNLLLVFNSRTRSVPGFNDAEHDAAAADVPADTGVSEQGTAEGVNGAAAVETANHAQTAEGETSVVPTDNTSTADATASPSPASAESQAAAQATEPPPTTAPPAQPERAPENGGGD
jgi:rod shape-determining protein MreC